MYTAAKNLKYFLFLLCPSYAVADQSSVQHGMELTPTMAAFYSVDRDGRSVRDEPVVEAVLTPVAGSIRTVKVVHAKINRKQRRETPTSQLISIRISPRRYDVFEAYRCERHRFYYTDDGRCISPGIRGKHSAKRKKLKPVASTGWRRAASAPGRNRKASMRSKGKRKDRSW